MLTVDARGDACPLPVVKAKKAIAELNGAGEVEVLVDNEIAVQNLTKMAQQKGYRSAAEKMAEREYRVLFTVGEPAAEEEEAPACAPDARTDTVVVIASDKMGEGAEELGKTLLKAFIFSLTQQDKLPKTILLYNGGAHLTCEGSPMLDDLKALEAEGVEILTCGTCLNFYGLTEKLAVGGVTNMYVIAEKMLNAGNVVKPCSTSTTPLPPCNRRPVWARLCWMHWNMRAIRAAGRMSRPFTRPVSSTMPVRHLQHFSMRKARTALLSRPT